MNAINSAISTINVGIRYLKLNAWPIVCLLAALYVLKTQFVDKGGSGFQGYSYTLSSASASSGSDTARSASTGSRQEEMREVRLQQQENANQRALEGEKQRKLKQQEEKKRKNEVAKAKAKNSTSDNRLGGDARGGFNPMQPWTGSTGGYKAQRRSTRRG